LFVGARVGARQIASISLEVFLDHEFELPSGLVITLVIEIVVQVRREAGESVKQRRVKVIATTAFEDFHCFVKRHRRLYQFA